MTDKLTESPTVKSVGSIDWLAIWDEFKTTRSMMESCVINRSNGSWGILVGDDEWALMYQTTELRHTELSNMIFDFIKANAECNHEETQPRS